MTSPSPSPVVAPGWVCLSNAALAEAESESGGIVRVSDCPPIALTRVKGELVAFLDVCPHLGATLSAEGELRRGKIVCHAHGRAYRLLRDGDRLRGVERGLRQLRVRVMDGCVHVLTHPSLVPSGSR